MWISKRGQNNSDCYRPQPSAQETKKCAVSKDFQTPKNLKGYPEVTKCGNLKGQKKENFKGPHPLNMDFQRTSRFYKALFFY